MPWRGKQFYTLRKLIWFYFFGLCSVDCTENIRLNQRKLISRLCNENRVQDHILCAWNAVSANDYRLNGIRFCFCYTCERSIAGKTAARKDKVLTALWLLQLQRQHCSSSFTPTLAAPKSSKKGHLYNTTVAHFLERA